MGNLTPEMSTYTTCHMVFLSPSIPLSYFVFLFSLSSCPRPAVCLSVHLLSGSPLCGSLISVPCLPVSLACLLVLLLFACFFNRCGTISPRRRSCQVLCQAVINTHTQNHSRFLPLWLSPTVDFLTFLKDKHTHSVFLFINHSVIVCAFWTNTHSLLYSTPLFN